MTLKREKLMINTGKMPSKRVWAVETHLIILLKYLNIFFGGGTFGGEY